MKDDSEKKQTNLQWRYQPLQRSPDGCLVEWLKTNPVLSLNEALLAPARAFWLPLALLAQPEAVRDVEQARRAGREAIGVLERQIERLRSELELSPGGARR
ncbi:hypothetical protein [Lusitaniella coriacea]|uniref:hypothetical protein n=1 Tax=Lusitaniella coriacea TaxID=1983105 RepID=UPI003CF6E19D